jgi:hypothetical protein
MQKRGEIAVIDGDDLKNQDKKREIEDKLQRKVM